VAYSGKAVLSAGNSASCWEWVAALPWPRPHHVRHCSSAHQQTPLGRAQLRERVAVEHTVAHVGHWQGRRGRYRGLRKNLLAVCRCAVVDNLYVLRHVPAFRRERQEAA